MNRALAFLFVLVELVSGCRRVDGKAEDKAAAAHDAAPAASATTGVSDGAPAKKSAHRPLLWEVTSPGGKSSWLLGTMHLGFDYEDLPPVVWQKLGASVSVVLELDPREMNPAAVQARTALPEGQSLRKLLGEPSWEKLKVAAGGIPEMILDRLQPWAAAQLVLARLHPTVMPLDLAVLRDAEKGGKQLVFLESLDFQLDLIAEVMDAKALAEMVDDSSKERALLARTVEAYRRGDAAELERAALDPANFADRPGVADKFLFKRNRDWIPRLTPLLDQGGAFVAVGAAHLLGDQGLLKLLADKGYRSARVAP